MRVLLVEPGIIDTAMAQRIGRPGAGSAYTQPDRLAMVFASALQQPVPPSRVAAKLLEIFASGTWQFRHLVGLVGPDAGPVTGLRPAHQR